MHWAPWWWWWQDSVGTSQDMPSTILLPSLVDTALPRK
ncbi:hypothetical protein E2C01_081446 [Portunus trituberculatus]|uniref:Uncharacterized protein n=1 Tax=Portunus trituberculatus TaxID=210409 RepID=A0A5B7IRY6_PORTR|nr:hypothetical protein [Portunus trituberculatus]